MQARPSMRLAITASVLTLLAACESLPDFDLRDLGDGFDTSEAVANLPERPQPDENGVITYPNYQVVVARPGDTIRTIATRLNVDAQTLANFNGIEPDITLRADELIALPSQLQVAAGAPSGAALDITAVATSALDRADAAQGGATQAVPPAGTQQGVEPIRHRVERGETVFSISRLYNVPVRNIAEWNGLGPDLDVREGQFLLVPQGAIAAPLNATDLNTTTEPGEGTPTPVPPSSTLALPLETPSVTPPAATTAPEAPDLGEPTAAPDTSSARFQYPVEGTIIREYAPGRNEGIDISVPTGTDVRAADGGTVAAVTEDTAGVAIVVIRHPDELLTVYTNIEGLTVEKNDRVQQGQTIGKVGGGDPSFLHFEVRKGLQSADPADFLP